MTATRSLLVECQALGLSAQETAERLGVSARTVRRWRSQYVTPSAWTPTPPAHGTRSRYQAGCSCAPCRAANAAYTAAHRAVYARSRLTRQEARTR